MTVRVEKRLFSVHEYHRMSEAGLFNEDDRVELIEGEILEMTPVGARHVRYVNRLTMLLASFASEVDKGYVVSVQNPVRLNDRVEPQPDLALLRETSDVGALPIPDDVLLLIEVSNTSLDYDREMKLPLYARAGIPEVWIVDLMSERIELHARPKGGLYSESRWERLGETMISSTVPGLELFVDPVFG